MLTCVPSVLVVLSVFFKPLPLLERCCGHSVFGAVGVCIHVSKIIYYIIIIIIHEFHRDASLETKLQGRYVSRITLQLLCNVNAAVADSLHCRMICGTVPFSVHA